MGFPGFSRFGDDFEPKVGWILLDAAGELGGLQSLPLDAEAAAKRSKTIHYQREVVQAWARSELTTLDHEIVSMEDEPDRASEKCLETISAALRDVPLSRVELVYVDFAEIHGTRYNRRIMERLERLGVTLNQLSPNPITMDGKRFDPIRHFHAWRVVNETSRVARQLMVATALAEALSRFPPGYGRWSAIAEHLNTEGITSVTGRLWNTESVKKAAAKVLNN